MEREYVRRRRVPRRAFDRRVGVLAEGHYEVGRSLQIGEGGMMIVPGQKLVQNQKIVLSFLLPGSLYVVVRGVVRYIVPAEGKAPVKYGIEFLNLDFAEKREIRNYVAAKAKGEALLAA